MSLLTFTWFKIALRLWLNSDYTVFDSWYTSLDNLWQLKKMGWRWFARMKENRLVCTAPEEFRAISDFEIPAQERIVQLKDYGPVKVLRTVREDGEVQYWATDDLKMDAKKRYELESMGWGIEVYHRCIKQCWGIEKAKVRGVRESGLPVLGSTLMAETASRTTGSRAFIASLIVRKNCCS